MSSDGYFYETLSGEYAVEGFAFRLEGPHGYCEIVPTRFLGPPVRDNAISTRVEMRAEISVEGTRANQFRASLTVLPTPASVLSRLSRDIDVFISGACEVIEFPSPDAIEFQATCLDCRLSRDRYSTTGFSLMCRLADPNWWSGDAPPPLDLYDHYRVAATLCVLMDVHHESLERMGLEIRRFISLLERFST